MKLTKKISIALFLTVISITIAFTQTIPQKISYQGELLEDGEPVTGTKNFTFTFVGTEWSEQHSNVEIENGLYAVTLGQYIPIPLTVFENSNSAALQINIDGTNLEPQIEILSVAYAFKALKANSADSLAGKEASTYQNIESINRLQGDENGNVEIVGGENVTVTAENNAIAISAAAQTGGSLPMPTMMSEPTGSYVYWGTAANYCYNLTEGGYDDWRMPSAEEITYLLTGGSQTAITLQTYCWTRTIYNSDYNSWTVLRWNEVEAMTSNSGSVEARCVR